MSVQPARLEILLSHNNVGYGSLPIPCYRDRELKDLVSELSREENVEGSAQLLSRKHSSVLGAYAERMASLAIRTKSVEILQSGLDALGLTLDITADVKDVQPPLSLLLRACQLIGIDPLIEFADLSSISSAGASAVRTFMCRDTRDQLISSMGYIESHDDDGFRFERTW
jgi:hypothetical protein